MENQNMENNQAQSQGTVESDQTQSGQSTGSAGQEKLFTQEEVNRIIGDRLARAKSANGYGIDPEREAALNERELKLDAREQLADLGISKDLLPLVNCTNKDTMKKSIALIAENFGQGKSANNTGRTYRISTGANSSGNGSGHSRAPSDDDIRAAMGLKGK